MKTIPFASFEGMHAPLRQEMLDAFARMYDKGWFIQGQECQAFEEEFAAYCGTRYAVGVASGLDALTLALKALGVGEGDEVIIPGNTFIATALAVTYAAVSYTHLPWMPPTRCSSPKASTATRSCGACSPSALTTPCGLTPWAPPSR